MKALVLTLVANLFLIPPATPDRSLHVPLTLTLIPSVCLSPCSARATIHFERHPDNQRITLELSGPIFYRHSEIDIQRHPVTFEVWYYGIPDGHYTYIAQLIRHEQVVFQEVRNLLVGSDDGVPSRSEDVVSGPDAADRK